MAMEIFICKACCSICFFISTHLNWKIYTLYYLFTGILPFSLCIFFWVIFLCRHTFWLLYGPCVGANGVVLAFHLYFRLHQIYFACNSTPTSFSFWAVKEFSVKVDEMRLHRHLEKDDIGSGQMRAGEASSENKKLGRCKLSQMQYITVQHPPCFWNIIFLSGLNFTIIKDTLKSIVSVVFLCF